MDDQAFDNVVRGVIEDLPEEFLPALENVAIVIVDEPDPTVAFRIRRLLDLR